MIPGMGMNPRQMGRAMEQLGMKTEDIPSDKVEIFKKGGSKLVIDSPSIVKMSMQGQDTYMISGVAREVEGGPSPEDIKMVAESTGKPEDEAKAALVESNGDIAAAILKLKPE